VLALFAFTLCALTQSFASAYNGHPKLIVVIVIDQFRGDYLERYRDQFGEGGFRLLLDHGAYFPNCNYNYANTRTAPGHATLFTGAYRTATASSPTNGGIKARSAPSRRSKTTAPSWSAWAQAQVEIRPAHRRTIFWPIPWATNSSWPRKASRACLACR